MMKKRNLMLFLAILSSLILLSGCSSGKTTAKESSKTAGTSSKKSKDSEENELIMPCILYSKMKENLIIEEKKVRKEGPSTLSENLEWSDREYTDSTDGIHFTVPEKLYIGNAKESMVIPEEMDVAQVPLDSEQRDLTGEVKFLVFTKKGSYVLLASDEEEQDKLVGASPESSRSELEANLKKISDGKIGSIQDKKVTVAGMEFSGYEAAFTVEKKKYRKENLFFQKDGRVLFLSCLFVGGEDKELTDFLQSWTPAE